eukprot:gene3634-4163_t
MVFLFMNALTNATQLYEQLNFMKDNSMISGVMTDVWWGLVETQPQQYNWSGYEQLFQIVAKANLNIKVTISFHECGDFMSSFKENFAQFIPNILREVQVGLGPAGEMRYPSYQLAYWTFPGVGEFQCYDKYLLAQLAAAANASNNPLWGGAGPDNAGNYNSFPQSTGFFYNGYDNYQSDYGQFFLTWYSNTLIQHGDSILSQAASIFGSTGVNVTAKVSGIHWWYGDPSHAAELTAGYKNDLGQGYITDWVEQDCSLIK